MKIVNTDEQIKQNTAKFFFCCKHIKGREVSGLFSLELEHILNVLT